MLESKSCSRLLRPTVVAALIALHGGAGFAAESDTLDGKPPVGTIQLSQVQAAYIGSGSTGEGTLRFKGRSYSFNVNGLGIGGIGYSKITASGKVYGLESIEQFPGAYVQGRYGYALGDNSAGDLWLKNENGVTLHLKAKRKGLMLSLGGDAVSISMAKK